MERAADETAKIEHELEILRSRYAIFERWAKIARWFFIGLAVIITSAGLGYGIIYDPLVAAIVLVVAAMIGGAAYLTRGDPEGRWIDVVSWWPWARIFGIGPKSEAAAIESMITEREARLNETRNRQT